MKTDDLIRLLAADTLPVARGAASRRIAVSLLVSLPVAVLILLLYGLRPDLAEAARLPMFWVKLAFPAAVCIAAFAVMQRLARPGVRPGASWLALAVPVLLMGALAASSLADAPAGERMSMVWGQTWRSCSANIAVVSLPVFIAAFAAVRSLAPTRQAWAGACAGAMAGRAGATVYALHCPELEAPFLAVWYMLGILLPVAAGALLGPRLLRW